MCFSFGRLARRELPEPARVQVRRSRRLIWLECVDRTTPLIVCRKLTTSDSRLLAVQLNDQLLIHRQLNIFAFRQVQDSRFVIVAIHFQPAGQRAVAGELLRRLQHCKLLAVLANGNLFPRAHFIRRNVHLPVIDSDVPVTHQLARLAPRLGKPKPEDDIVEATLELLQQLLAGHTPGTGSLLEVVSELAFLGEVDSLRFLLFTQLQTVTHDLGLAVLPMLPGSEIALLDGTLIAEALCAFEEQLHALAAA